MNGPEVSVLMPVYNGGSYLKTAIDSILEQTFRDFEFVIVDDGSDDLTAETLRSYDDRRLRIISTEHSGLITALNTCCAHARGRLWARMDADDISMADRLASQVEYLKRYPDVDLVTCHSELIDREGSVVGGQSPEVSDPLLSLSAGNSIVHGSVMVRPGCLPLPCYERAPEDYRLWVRLAREGRRFGLIPKVLYRFRSHPARYSLVHSASQSRGILEVQWSLLEQCNRERDLTSPSVQRILMKGWAVVGGAAYCCGEADKAAEAVARFRALIPRRCDSETTDAVIHGIESLVWGGCPTIVAVRLRLIEWRLRPLKLLTYKKLLLALPQLRKLTQRGHS